MIEQNECNGETVQIRRSAARYDTSPINVIPLPCPRDRSAASTTSSSPKVSIRGDEEEGDLWLSGLAAAILMGVVGLLYYALFIVIAPKVTILPFAW